MFICESIGFFLTRGLFFRDIALLLFKDDYYSNKKIAAEEFSVFQRSKSDRVDTSMFANQIKRHYTVNKIDANNIQRDKNIKIYNINKNSNVSEDRLKSEFSYSPSNFLSTFSSKNKRERTKTVKNMVDTDYQNKYFNDSKNAIKYPVNIQYNYKDIKKINFITYIKSIFCKCFRSKNDLIFNKLKKMFCLLLSSDELIYNYMKNQYSNEYIRKKYDNCIKYNLI